MSLKAHTRLRVAIIAHNLDRNDIGEVGTSYQLIKAMIDIGEIEPVLLVLQNSQREAVASQFPGIEVHSWVEPSWLTRFERFNAMAKPAVPWFYAQARRWIRLRLKEGEKFDILHQILPRAPRYTSRLSGLGVPYIIGPVGGAIPMPKAFRESNENEPWFTKFRRLDQFRFKYDPFLRRGFQEADLVLGVAPYMREILADLQIKRFLPFLGIGTTSVEPYFERTISSNKLKLLHVGRAVRTKGLRESVKALAHLKDQPDVTLTVIGQGPEIGVAKKLAEDAGVIDRIQFEGHKPRVEIEEYYKSHDALLFPSFRESMGGVIYEAMRWGMPIITVDHGGPGFIVDGSCGLKAALTNPDTLAFALSKHIRKLADNPELRVQLGKGALQRISSEALWPAKAQRMLDIYKEVAANK